MQSAVSLIADIRASKLSPVALVEQCLARIDAADGELAAWVHLDREGALATARKLEASKPSGALAGLPVGIKDIFDVAGMPTGFGAAPYARTTPDRDSTAVARLRAAGAIILGKTATTEFAYLDPAATKNPWNLAHTPGGSSSGSGASVGAGMVPVALGSQTVGSTLRPAAYCGAVGLKPTHGRISGAGVHPLAPSFDHPGIICRHVEDAALVLGVLAGPDDADPYTVDRPVDDYLAAARAAPTPRLGLPRSFYHGVAGDEVANHLDAVAERLRAAGADIVDLEMPAGAQQVVDLGQRIMRAETANVHAERFAAHRDEYRQNLRGLIEAGIALPATDYVAAKSALLSWRAGFVRLLETVDALLIPVATSTAPLGLASTGGPIFCAPASFAGLPAIALPSGIASDGLPLSVQLVAGPFAEARLLGAAAWVERVLDFQAVSPLAAAV